jgi:hypothetical protein
LLSIFKVILFFFGQNGEQLEFLIILKLYINHDEIKRKLSGKIKDD